MTEQSAAAGENALMQESAPRFLAVVLHGRDTVATAVADIAAQAEPPILRDGAIEGGVRVAANIPFGHKFAIRPMRAGAEVVKYGEVIGLARTDIGVGEHVHVHNVESQRGRGDLAGEGDRNG